MFARLLLASNATVVTDAADVTGATGAADATGAAGSTKNLFRIRHWYIYHDLNNFGYYLILFIQRDSLQTHLPALDICITAWSNEKAENLFPFKIRPNCSVYPKEISPKLTNSSLTKFFIKHKSHPSMDPFIGLMCISSTLCINPFMKDSKEGLNTLGQITCYVTSHLGSQFQTHAFFVLIVHNYVRIIQWDRGSAVVIAPIHFNEKCHLFDFFVHYNYAKSNI